MVDKGLNEYHYDALAMNELTTSNIFFVGKGLNESSSGALAMNG